MLLKISRTYQIGGQQPVCRGGAICWQAWANAHPSFGFLTNWDELFSQIYCKITTYWWSCPTKITAGRKRRGFREFRLAASQQRTLLRRLRGEERRTWADGPIISVLNDNVVLVCPGKKTFLDPPLLLHHIYIVHWLGKTLLIRFREVKSCVSKHVDEKKSLFIPLQWHIAGNLLIEVP